APIRCTQNPTMGEEWRRDWHPEHIKSKHKHESILIVGTGPAGLECAHALAKRGYEIVMAEKKSEAGGRVLLESQLPGLSEWKRVMDYRMNALQQMPNVEIYYESEVTADNIEEFGFENIIIATGAQWKNNGQGRDSREILPTDNSIKILTPDDLMNGEVLKGEVVIYDTDHYYMAGVLAEKCINLGCKVSYMSPANRVSDWTENTLEQQRIQTQLMNKDVDLLLTQSLVEIKDAQLISECIYTRKKNYTDCKTLVLVTERKPNDALFTAIEENHKFKHFALIGDAYAPGIIAQAVHSGHLEAQFFGEKNPNINVFKRDKGYNSAQ
ncbi:MAG: FAD-dependent oxidoreductase, partial [Marinicellaceae bacterium]